MLQDFFGTIYPQRAGKTQRKKIYIKKKGIRLGNVMDVTSIGSLFKLCDDKSSVLFIEPPVERL